MRAVSTALSLSLLIVATAAGRARAECRCVCADEQPVGICSQTYERPPICQQICTRSLSQVLPSSNLNSPIASGSVYGTSDPREVARQVGVGSTRGPSSAILPP